MDQSESGRLLEYLAGIEGAANMWEAGEALGMQRQDTENAATDLMAQGYLAIANLSGGVRVTQEGLDWLQKNGGGPAGQAAPDLDGWLQSVENAGSLGLSGAGLQDFRLDMETLRLQSRRSGSLPGVLSACLGAVHKALAASSDPQAAELATQAEALLEQIK